MVGHVRTQHEFAALSRSRSRGRSGPVWVARADHVLGPDTRSDLACVAYAIGSRVGGAVVRNRLRRRMRAVMADLEADGTLVPGLYLVGARSEAADVPFAELAHHLGRATARVTGADGSSRS